MYQCKVRRAMLCAFFVIFLQISTIFAARRNSLVDANGVVVSYNSDSFGNVEFENSLVKEDDDAYATDFRSVNCSVLPAACSGLSLFTRRFFGFGNYPGAFEARGAKDLIGIVSTMLATLLGAILVKLNVLIVLSMISVGIGKLFVLFVTRKSHLFADETQQQQPVVYEEVYYPHYREYGNPVLQSYHEDYPAYNLSR